MSSLTLPDLTNHVYICPTHRLQVELVSSYLNLAGNTFDSIYTHHLPASVHLALTVPDSMSGINSLDVLGSGISDTASIGTVLQAFFYGTSVYPLPTFYLWY